MYIKIGECLQNVQILMKCSEYCINTSYIICEYYNMIILYAFPLNITIRMKYFHEHLYITFTFCKYS